MGHVGSGREHSSGFRSFEVTCSTYNVDNSSLPRQFVVRCFFDHSPRWKAYAIPRRGSLVHAVGAWVGRYALEGEAGQFQPAILVTGGFRSLASSAVPDTDPTTPSPKKGIPKFAPPGYLGPKALLSSTPTTPSQGRPSDSGAESHQTPLRTNSVDDGGISDTPTFQDGVLGSAAIGEHAPTAAAAAAAASESPVGSRKRRRRGSR